MNKNSEIKKHEKLKQLSEYVYNVNQKQLPEGYDLIYSAIFRNFVL